MDSYPDNSTAKVFYDIEGDPTTLYQLIRNEPEWAQSRHIEMEKLISQLQSQIKDHNEMLIVAYMGGTHSRNDEVRILQSRLDVAEKVTRGIAITSYECGHNDTVESNYYGPEERVDEIIEEALNKQEPGGGE